QAASEYYYKELLPALEQVFNELAGENELLSISKMEIDLGFINWQQQQKNISITNLQGLVRQQIQQQLEELQTQKSSASFFSGEQQQAVVKIPLRQHAAEQWLYYMEKGLIPWGMDRVTTAWQTKALETFATSITHAELLRKLVKEQPRALARIVREHDETFLVQLVIVLTATAHTQLPEWISELQTIYEIIFAGQRIPVRPVIGNKPVTLWGILLNTAARAASGTTTQQLAETIIEQWLRQQPVTKNQLSDINKQARLTKQIVEERAITIKPAVTGEQGTLPKNKKLKPKKEEPPQQVAGKAEQLLPGSTKKQPAQPDTSEERPKKTKTEPPAEEPAIPEFKTATIPEEGIFVAHAGLVLVHPFLRFLFKNTGLYKEGAFISAAAKEQAVMLAHFLATGNNTGEEHLLAIPKILCGWPLDEPLQQYEQLLAIEEQEANDLLNAAIAQWSILKKTSADGLREGFLQRNGKIFTRSNGIYIQVEKAAIDVLLDHLPWNLGLIKLPWLKELIHVEWR
ncbi:MAG: hypothetical protein JNM68_06085, partial [Dinghuibacter sp.]|nr:hypothetical protein [Dinghuibacter sp.]